MAEERVTNTGLVDFQPLPPLVVDPKNFGSTATAAYKQISRIQDRTRALTDQLPHSPLAGLLTILNAQRARGKQGELNELRIATKAQEDAVTRATAEADRRKLQMSDLVQTGQAHAMGKVADIWHNGDKDKALNDPDLHLRMKYLPMDNDERNKMRLVVNQFQERLEKTGLNIAHESYLNMQAAVKQMLSDLKVDRAKRKHIKDGNPHLIAAVVNSQNFLLDHEDVVEQFIKEDDAATAAKKSEAVSPIAMAKPTGLLNKNVAAVVAQHDKLNPNVNFQEGSITADTTGFPTSFLKPKVMAGSTTFTAEPTYADFVAEMTEKGVSKVSRTLYNGVDWFNKKFPIGEVIYESWNGRPDHVQMTHAPTGITYVLKPDGSIVLPKQAGVNVVPQKVTKEEAAAKLQSAVATGTDSAGSFDFVAEKDAETAKHIAAGGPGATKLLDQDDAIRIAEQEKVRNQVIAEQNVAKFKKEQDAPHPIGGVQEILENDEYIGPLAKFGRQVSDLLDENAQDFLTIIDNEMLGGQLVEMIEAGEVWFNNLGEAAMNFHDPNEPFTTEKGQIAAAFTKSYNNVKKIKDASDTGVPIATATTIGGVVTPPPSVAASQANAANLKFGGGGGGMGGPYVSNHTYAKLLEGIESPKKSVNGKTDITSYKNRPRADAKGRIQPVWTSTGKVPTDAQGKNSISAKTAQGMQLGKSLGFDKMSIKEVRVELQDDNLNDQFRDQLVDLIQIKADSNQYTKGWALLDRQAMVLTAYNANAENYFRTVVDKIKPTSLQDFVNKAKGVITDENYNHMKKIIKAQRRSHSIVY